MDSNILNKWRGDRLKKARGKTSLRALGELIGEDKSTISRWESGTRPPSANDVLKLAEVLGCSAAWLLGEDPAPVAADVAAKETPATMNMELGGEALDILGALAQEGSQQVARLANLFKRLQFLGANVHEVLTRLNSRIAGRH